MYADIIIKNGRCVTMCGDGGADWVAAAGKMICAAGRGDDWQKLVRPGTQVIDARGGTVLRTLWGSASEAALGRSAPFPARPRAGARLSLEESRRKEHQGGRGSSSLDPPFLVWGDPAGVLLLFFPGLRPCILRP